MKKICLLLIYLLFISMLIASCKEKGESSSSELIFGSGVDTRIVASEADYEDLRTLLTQIKDKICEIPGASAGIENDLVPKTSHEIVVGNTDRDLSGAAKDAMQRAINAAARREENEDEYLLAFTIYADECSVAIVYNDERIKAKAVNYFLDNYFVGDGLMLKDGYSHSEVTTLLAYLEERDSEVEEAEWAEVEAKLGTEATEALKNHYTLFDERFYLWLADLYDPITGGFYCTNAGRDNHGYLPDIQSTAQVLAFLNNSGMTKEYGGWEYALPADITDSIAEFVKGLQSSEDGYFYHPQWEGLDYTTSRLGRDVNWASEILKPLYNMYSEKYIAEEYSEDEATELLKKYMPYWDTPGGLRGYLGKPGSGARLTSSTSLTSRLGVHHKGAVLVALSATASSTWTPQLRSLDAWRAYLYGGTVDGINYPGLDIEMDSYTVGNTLAAQTAQITQRDVEAKKNGEATGYAELTREFLDTTVKADNGLWEKNVKYNSVNGLMKIVSVYNSMHWELLYPDMAMQSAITVASLSEPDVDGKEPTDAVDVYNPWVCISGIFTNVSQYNRTLDKKSFEATWRTLVTENAASMISGTTQKIGKFAKNDGSYGYHWGAPPVHAQGMPVTVSGIVCGDVDGACVSSTGTITRMCDALGLSNIPCLFGSADMEIFNRRILGHGSIIKNTEIDTEVFVYDFEDETPGEDYLYAEGRVGNGERIVVESNSNDKSNKYMLSIKDKDPLTGVTTMLASTGVSKDKATCYILEFDIYLEDVKKGDYLEIKIGSGDTAAYMLTVVGKDDGSASLGDHSGTSAGISKSFGKSIPAKEWHTVRVEYYVGTASTVVIKNFLDGRLICTSNNYYGRRSSTVVEPEPTYGVATFYSTYDSTITYYLDNITVEKAKKHYVPEAIYNPDRIKSFEGESLPSGVKAPDSTIVEDPSGKSNSMLRANGTVTVNTTEHITPANTFVFKSDIYISNAPDGDIATLYMTSGIASESVYALTLRAVTEGSERFIKILTTTRSGVTEEVVGTAPIGELFVLRVEYYRYQYSENYSKIQSIVYINGAESGRSETGYYLYNVARDYNKLIFKVLSGYDVFLDNLIAENDKIDFRDSSGKPVSDPKNPIFPQGGLGGSQEPDAEYNGRIDFEDSPLGVPEIPGLTTVPNSNEFGNDIEVATDPTDTGNKALLISTVSSTRAGNRAYIIPYEIMPDSNCYVLEWDMYITEGSIPYYQIKVGDCFCLELRGTTTLRILTKSTNPTDGSGRIETTLGGGHKLTVGEWHNIRIEYYCGDAETVKIIVYVDDSVYETNHFYGKGTNVVGTPTNLFGADNPALIYSAYDSSADVYFDNIIAEKIVKEYPTIDTDEPEEPGDGGSGEGGAGGSEGGTEGGGTDEGGSDTDEPSDGDNPTPPEEGGGIVVDPDFIPSEDEPHPDEINPGWSDP